MQLEMLGELRLLRAPQPGRPLHLSAASGLVKVAARLYVVADDELHLGIFAAAGGTPGTLLRMFAGDLPEAASARKQRKPDLEALVALPPFADHPHGALLALGSGSKQQRRRGVLLPLSEREDEYGIAAARLRVLDLADWFDGFAATVPDLNIEGAVVWREQLVLMQRGSRGNPGSYLIGVDLQALLSALAQGDVLPRMAVRTFERYDLGDIAGVPLCFTDGAALPDGRLIFAAVAEDTDDSYLDGPCRGAALGVIDSAGRLSSLHPLQQPYKVEGLHAELRGTQVQLWLVTDADDASVPASLLRGVLPE